MTFDGSTMELAFFVTKNLGAVTLQEKKENVIN